MGGNKIRRVVFPALFCTAATLCGPAEEARAQTDLHGTIEQFDEVRALCMRGLLRAQELKTACLYGRGFGLDTPEYVPEDMLIEGLWLFDYLNSMDYTSLALASYAAASDHPNLTQELAVFRSFLAEAAQKTLAYHDKASKALARAVAEVKAAAVEKAPFNLQEVTPQPGTNAPIQAFAGDGFRLGWSWPTLPGEQTNLGKYLTQHGYTNERLFQLAVQAGIEFIRPEDPNLFDWADVETEEGNCQWSRIDELLALYKKYNLALWLPIPSYTSSPPQWLRDRLKNKAVLTAADGAPLTVRAEGGNFFCGIRDARQQNNPPNLFEPDVGAAFARFIRQLVSHVKASGVRIVAVELGGRYALPLYSGPQAQARWQVWLQRNKIDPRKRWQMEIDTWKAVLPDSMAAPGVTDAGRKRMLLDFERWREEEYIQYMRAQVEAVRAVAPEPPICAHACEEAEFNQSMEGRHNERLVRELGVVPMHSSTGESIWDDLRRCYSLTHWSACSGHTGSGNAFSQYSFSSYIHGTLTIWTWPTPIARGFYWGDCFFYPDMRWRWSSLGGWRRFHERAQGMAPEMLNTRPAPQVAVMWSDTSSKYQSFIAEYPGGTYGFRKGAANYTKIGCIGWDRILNSLCLAHDFVTEDQVREGGLQQYQMLVMPAVQALPGDVAQRVREYVQNGGVVIATSAPALFGDDMEQKGGGQLAGVFGAEFDRFLGKSVIAETPMGTPNWNEPLLHYWDGPNKVKGELQTDSLRTLYCTFKPRDGAEVIEKFTSGEPAVILNSLGKGKAVVIGYPFGRESFLSDIYHEHYGHNWADWPYGSVFQQGLFRWFELLLARLQFEREAVASEEIVPRAIGQDAGWPCWQFTRKGGGYRDYVWKSGKMRDTTVQPDYGESAPRSIELVFRRGQNNPNLYLTIFNREGAYGHDPGVVHFEATSKDIKIELPRTDISQLYDLSLGCPVPFKIENRLTADRRAVTTFRTMIEPSMARMFVIATQEVVIHTYSGNRDHGRGDEEIRQAVARLVTNRPAPDHVVIAPADVTAFLTERGPDGITVSCESPTYLPAAELLADAIEEAFGRPVRITRNSPRIWGSHCGLGVWRSERHTVIEQPDILLGSHNESHYIASQVISPGRGHTMPLPIVSSHTFPGPGRSVVCLLRPYTKHNVENVEGRLFGEEPAPTKLVVCASDAKGLETGAENVIKLIQRSNPPN